MNKYVAHEKIVIGTIGQGNALFENQNDMPMYR